MLYNKDFLTLKDFSAQEILYLLNLSADLKAKKQKGIRGSALQGKSIVQIFEKQSTRTRSAFEVAAYDEGAWSTVLTNSHLGDKESVEDTAQVLARMYSGIMFRGYKHSTIESLARYASVPVWNGLTDDYHPTQVLADLLTIQEHVKKPLSEVKIVFAGDASNNVARSLVVASAIMGMRCTLLAPEGFVPTSAFLSDAHSLALAHSSTNTSAQNQNSARIQSTTNIAEAMRGADVVYTDVWASMGDESDLERRVSLLAPYRVTMDMLGRSGNADIIFLHCLPAMHDLNTGTGRKIYEKFGIREMEVSDEVFRSTHSRVFDQAENRLHSIKAVLVATLSPSATQPITAL